MPANRPYAHRLLKAEFRRFIQTYWRVLALIVAIIAGLAILEFRFSRSGFLGGLIVGAGAVTLIGLVLLMFLVTSGRIGTVAGQIGEFWTRDALRAAVKSGQVWGAVHNIEVGGMDIDHLLLAPQGIYAVETKLGSKPLAPDRKRRYQDQSRSHAARASAVLRSVEVALPAPVEPVLVVWGRASDDLPDQGVLADGVLVLPGRGLRDWLAQQATGPVGQERAEETVRRLELFKAAHPGRAVVLR